MSEIGGKSDAESNRIGSVQVQDAAAYLSTSWDVNACP